MGDNAGTDDEDMGDDGGSDGGGGGNYFDGEAEEQWYRENVYTDIDIAYNKAFSDGVPGVASSPSDGDLYISHFERFLANNVQKVGYKQRFWENRKLRGDTFAPVALDVVHNRWPGQLANLLSFQNTKLIGENLVVDYVKAIDKDVANTHPDNVRGQLSRDQIDEWHDYTFSRTPGLQSYGGSWQYDMLGFITFGGFGLIGTPNDIICGSGCDSYNPH